MSAAPPEPLLCDTCGQPVAEEYRWRHRECMAQLPAVALDAIEAAHSLAGAR